MIMCMIECALLINSHALSECCLASLTLEAMLPHITSEQSSERSEVFCEARNHAIA